MADASNIKIAVESVIHKALTESIQRIFDEHGIRIKELNVSWICYQRIEEARPRCSIQELQVNAVSNPDAAAAARELSK